MNNHTLFFSDLVTLIFYASGLGLLSFSNRRFVGLRWFFGTELLFAVKSVLQGFFGVLPHYFSYFIANELVACAFACMYLGFAYSAEKPPERRWLAPAILAAGFAAYLAAYVLRWHGMFIAASAPCLIFCLMAIALLLRPGAPEFRAVSRVSIALIAAHLAVLLFRIVLITLHAAGAAASRQAVFQHYFSGSMMALMFIDAGLAGCYVWFFVAGLHRDLHRLAITDPLTGALNRRALEAEAERELARGLRSGFPLSVLVLDIDHFKLLNDSRGHHAGDAVLCALVQLLRRESRAADLIARSGGEEFIVLLPDAGLEQSLEAAERLRRAVEETPVDFEDGRLRYTVSIGAASRNAQLSTWDALLRAADKALYRAKAFGRNRVMPASEGSSPASSADWHAAAHHGS